MNRYIDIFMIYLENQIQFKFKNTQKKTFETPLKSFIVFIALNILFSISGYGHNLIKKQINTSYEAISNFSLEYTKIQPFALSEIAVNKILNNRKLSSQTPLLLYSNNTKTETNYESNDAKPTVGSPEQANTTTTFKSGIYWAVAASILLLIVTALLVRLTIRIRNIRKEADLIKSGYEELQNLNKDLTCQNKSKDKLISIIGHDVNTSILSMFEIISIIHPTNSLLEESEKLSLFDDLQIVSQETSQFFTNIVLWAKVQLSAFQPEKIEYEFNDLVNEVKNIFSYTSKSKNIELKYTGETNSTLVGDRMVTKIVLINLISNALKFTNKGGHVLVSFFEDSENFTICVNDSGIGISQKLSRDIFDYTKIKPAFGTRSEKGLGLGLYICKELVEKNGGKIWFESKEDQGSQFYFTIPKI